MAFGNISTFYIPTAANAGASQWGSDVRKLLSAADAGSDATSKTDHSTGGAVNRTVDPYSTSTTDTTEANFGWAINPTDMNSISGARRFFPAGNHVVTVRMGHNGTTADTGTLFMYAYRVGDAAGGRVRTLLGSASASVALPALSGEVTASVTLALAEVVFGIDETIQYSFEFTATGIIAVGRIATFYCGTQTAVATRLDTPILKVLADTTGTATGTGDAVGVTGKVLGTNGTATGTGDASGVGASRADTTGSAVGSVVVAGQGSSVAGTIGTATGLGTASGLSSIVLGTIGTVAIGGGGSTTIKKIFVVLDE